MEVFDEMMVESLVVACPAEQAALEVPT